MPSSSFHCNFVDGVGRDQWVLSQLHSGTRGQRNGLSARGGCWRLVLQIARLLSGAEEGIPWAQSTLPWLPLSKSTPLNRLGGSPAPESCSPGPQRAAPAWLAPPKPPPPTPLSAHPMPSQRAAKETAQQALQPQNASRKPRHSHHQPTTILGLPEWPCSLG